MIRRLRKIEEKHPRSKLTASQRAKAFLACCVPNRQLYSLSADDDNFCLEIHTCMGEMCLRINKRHSYERESENNNSSPIVGERSSKSPVANRISKLLLPTPLSPTSKICNDKYIRKLSIRVKL